MRKLLSHIFLINNVMVLVTFHDNFIGNMLVKYIDYFHDLNINSKIFEKGILCNFINKN